MQKRRYIKDHVMTNEQSFARMGKRKDRHLYHLWNSNYVVILTKPVRKSIKRKKFTEY